MKKKNQTLEFKKFINELNDIQILSLYCILYEEVQKRGFIERRWKI